MYPQEAFWSTIVAAQHVLDISVDHKRNVHQEKRHADVSVEFKTRGGKNRKSDDEN